MAAPREVRKRNKPKFNTIDEMAEFFDSTDSRELNWEDSNLRFERPKMKHVSIRIPEEDLKIIRHRASELGIGHTAMIRIILHRSVNQNRKRVKTR
ncbi:MAG: CopG family antitoxin [Eubacteriales bacterium]